LGNLNDAKARPQHDELEKAARELGIQVVAPPVSNPEDVVQAMEAIASQHVDVLIVLQTTMLLSERDKIAALAAKLQVPTIYGYRQHVEAGGLISYGVDLRWSFYRAAAYVQKILQGDAPSDLPVEFPSKLEMLINLKAARGLGITLSPQLLARADEVIE
jgi:putative ABC transport system substrate-binding protein